MRGVRFLASCFVVWTTMVATLIAQAGDDWPRFRGPNGQGVAADGARPPGEFGPDRNVAWKVELPPGHSSPAVANGRVFLTAFDGRTLETICLDAAGGTVLWRRPAPAGQVEKVNVSNSPAASTPAADADAGAVYVYFGSCGLLAYGRDGNELWHAPVPLPKNMFGTATSPVVAGNNVVLVRDSDAMDSYVVAVDRRTGKQAWKTPRPLSTGSWATPMLWAHDGLEELIVPGSGRVTAYDPATGAQRWLVTGFPQQPVTTPVAGDGLLFVEKGGQGDPGESFVKDVPKWADLLKQYDADGDGKVTPDEVPVDVGFELRKDIPRGTEGNFLSLRTLLRMIDRNRDGVTRFEWGMAGAFLSANEDVMLAIKPGGEGDATETHVAWKSRRGLPELPSPLFYRGRIYLVKNGGMVTCLDPKTGKQVYRERVDAAGPYYASPVAADGKMYAVSEAGVVSVIEAGDTFKLLGEIDLAERTTATPAIVGDTLYVRTARHLFAFRAP